MGSSLELLLLPGHSRHKAQQRPNHPSMSPGPQPILFAFPWILMTPQVTYALSFTYLPAQTLPFLPSTRSHPSHLHLVQGVVVGAHRDLRPLCHLVPLLPLLPLLCCPHQLPTDPLPSHVLQLEFHPIHQPARQFGRERVQPNNVQRVSDGFVQ